MAALDRGSFEVERSDFDNSLHIALADTRQRVSARSLDLIGRAEPEGHAALLGLLAGIALRRGGKIDCQAKQKFHTDAANCEQAVRLGLQYEVIAPIEDEIEDRYRFVEEGLPTYLWLMLVSGDNAARA